MAQARASRRRAVTLLIASALLMLPGCGPAHRTDSRVPAGYPGSYAETIAAAAEEQLVRIHATTDDDRVRDLIAGFRARYPDVHVVYANMPANAIYDGFLADLAAGRAPADLLWSSAMDQQIKLVNDGYAQSYASPEQERIPGWANWKQQAWGVTAEPIVMLYNKKLIEPATMPISHLGFQRLLENPDDRLVGRIATYDPTRSAVGYLFLSQDDAARHDAWRTVRGLGEGHARLFATTDDIIADVRAGRSVMGYNAVGSYVADAMTRDPNLALVLPRDYTLIMSRIAMIPARAPHPNAARLFLDYMLSREGQIALAHQFMPSVRMDVPRPAGLSVEGVPMRAIRVGPALLVQQDAMTRRHFERRWQQAIAGNPSAAPGKLRP